ncbi:hypothetical protein VIGAN_02249400, partial [Vigna angularis var. angularis]
ISLQETLVAAPSSAVTAILVDSCPLQRITRHHQSYATRVAIHNLQQLAIWLVVSGGRFCGGDWTAVLLARRRFGWCEGENGENWWLRHSKG